MVFQNNMDCLVRQGLCISAKRTYEERRDEKKRKEKKKGKVKKGGENDQENGAWKLRTNKINAIFMV